MLTAAMIRRFLIAVALLGGIGFAVHAPSPAHAAVFPSHSGR